MYITLKAFLHLSATLGLRSLYPKNENPKFYGFLLLPDDNTAVLSEEYLYLCQAKTLKNHPVSPDINLLVLNNGDIPEDELALITSRMLVLKGRKEIISVLNDVLAIKMSFDKWDTDMQEAMFQPNSLQKMIDLSEPYFPFPLVIFDCGYHLIAYTKNITSDYRFFNDVLVKKHVPSEVLHNLTKRENVKIKNSLLEQTGLIVGNSVGDSGYINVFKRIFSGSTLIYHCSFFCYDKNPTEAFLEFAELFFSYIMRHVKIHKELCIPAIKSFSYEAYTLLDLILGTPLSNESVADMLNYANLPTVGTFILLGILPENQNSANLTGYCDSLKTNLPYAHILLFDAKILILLEKKHKGTENFDVYHSKYLEHFMHENNGICAISNEFSEIFTIKNAYAQIIFTLKLQTEPNAFFPALPLGSKHSRIVRYSEVYLYHMLYHEGSHAVSQNIFTIKLMSFINHKGEMAVDFITTLYMYISCGCRYAQAAQILGIHRNSVIYRVEKLKELLGADFLNFEDALNVAIAIKELEIIKGINGDIKSKN